MKIIYIYHNCFIIDLGSKKLLFDYPKILNEEAVNFVINTIKNNDLIVFISHSHNDHFTEEVIELRKFVKSFICITSYDVIEASNRMKNLCYEVKDGDSLKIDNIIVDVYGSSDIGVSFLLKISSIKVYYAGDNANWKREQLPPELNEKIEKTFKKVISEIKNKEGSVDIAFLVFCEICEDYGGISYIVRELKPQLLVPMHLSGNTKIFETYKKYFKNLSCNIFTYHNLGDTYYV